MGFLKVLFKVENIFKLLYFLHKIIIWLNKLLKVIDLYDKILNK